MDLAPTGLALLGVGSPQRPPASHRAFADAALIDWIIIGTNSDGDDGNEAPGEEKVICYMVNSRPMVKKKKKKKKTKKQTSFEPVFGLTPSILSFAFA